MSTDTQLDHIALLRRKKEGKDKQRKNEFTVKYKEIDKVKTIDSCRILRLDKLGVIVEEVKHIGKNRSYFIPIYNLISVRSELI